MKYLILLLFPFGVFAQTTQTVQTTPLTQSSLNYTSVFSNIDPLKPTSLSLIKPLQWHTTFDYKDYNPTISLDRSLLMNRSLLLEPTVYSRTLQVNLFGGMEINPQQSAFNINPALREAVGNTAFEFGYETGAVFCPGGQ